MHRGSLQKHTEGEALPARHICSEDAFLLRRTLPSQTQDTVKKQPVFERPDMRSSQEGYTSQDSLLGL